MTAYTPLKIFAISLALLFLQACQLTPSTDSGKQTLNIEASYRERIMLPPNAELTVSLMESSKVVAKTEQTLNNAPPYALTLDYLSSAITSKSSYSLHAVIRHKDELLFTGTTPIDLGSNDGNTVIKIMLQQAATEAQHDADLGGATWQLLTLAGQTMTPAEGEKSANLSFDLKNKKIAGFAGCNRFFSSFESDQQTLTIAAIGATMMSCHQGMGLERKYLEALTKVNHYSIQQNQLVLYDDNGQPLATFNR